MSDSIRLKAVLVRRCQIETGVNTRVPAPEYLKGFTKVADVQGWEVLMVNLLSMRRDPMVLCDNMLPQMWYLVTEV